MKKWWFFGHRCQFVGLESYMCHIYEKCVTSVKTIWNIFIPYPMLLRLLYLVICKVKHNKKPRHADLSDQLNHVVMIATFGCKKTCCSKLSKKKNQKYMIYMIYMCVATDINPWTKPEVGGSQSARVRWGSVGCWGCFGFGANKSQICLRHTQQHCLKLEYQPAQVVIQNACKPSALCVRHPPVGFSCLGGLKVLWSRGFCCHHIPGPPRRSRLPSEFRVCLGAVCTCYHLIVKAQVCPKPHKHWTQQMQHHLIRWAQCTVMVSGCFFAAARYTEWSTNRLRSIGVGCFVATSQQNCATSSRPSGNLVKCAQILVKSAQIHNIPFIP